MRVDVDVALALMVMLMGVDSKGLSQRPRADGQEHHADEALAPGGEAFQREQVPPPEEEQSDGGHAGRMAEAPADARRPGAARAAHRQRRNRCEVVGAGPDVNYTGDKAGDGGNHSLTRAPRLANAWREFDRQCALSEGRGQRKVSRRSDAGHISLPPP